MPSAGVGCSGGQEVIASAEGRKRARGSLVPQPTKPGGVENRAIGPAPAIVPGHDARDRGLRSAIRTSTL